MPVFLRALVLEGAFGSLDLDRSLAQSPLEVFSKIDCPARYAISQRADRTLLDLIGGSARPCHEIDYVTFDG